MYEGNANIFGNTTTTCLTFQFCENRWYKEPRTPGRNYHNEEDEKSAVQSDFYRGVICQLQCKTTRMLSTCPCRVSVIKNRFISDTRTHSLTSVFFLFPSALWEQALLKQGYLRLSTLLWSSTDVVLALSHHQFKDRQVGDLAIFYRGPSVCLNTCLSIQLSFWCP